MTDGIYTYMEGKGSREKQQDVLRKLMNFTQQMDQNNVLKVFKESVVTKQCLVITKII